MFGNNNDALQKQIEEQKLRIDQLERMLAAVYKELKKSPTSIDSPTTSGWIKRVKELGDKL